MNVQMKAMPIIRNQINRIATGFNTIRNGTATWALMIGLVAGILSSCVVILNWFSGAAFSHGNRGLVTAIISTVLIVGFTVDSEVRIARRVLRKSS